MHTYIPGHVYMHNMNQIYKHIQIPSDRCFSGIYFEFVVYLKNIPHFFTHILKRTLILFINNAKWFG